MEEEIHTIEEDAIITGVASINGQTGDLNLKTVNGNEILGTGNIEIQAGVTSVNGDTGDVTITASGIGAASSSDLQTLASTVAGKQNALTIDQMTAVNSGIDSTKVGQIATNTQGISDEVTARQNADVNLQNQIDGLAASSDVTDIVGTKAALNAYDTTKLKDNDIIKVLQDESQDGETTYYRWSITTQTFTLIGEEGPYYTKSQTDTLLNAKQDDLVAGTNITIAADGKTISATDTTYTAGTNVSISSGNVISATDTTYSNFVGTDGTAAGTAGLVPAPATTDAAKYLKADGTWAEVAAGGGATPLTSADYNYHASGSEDDTVALWKMPAGIYESYSNGVKTATWSGQSIASNGVFIVRHPNTSVSTITSFISGVIYPDIPSLTSYGGSVVDILIKTATGERITKLATYGNGYRLLNTIEVQDNLTSTRDDVPLSANQGKVLKGLIDALDARVTALGG